MFDFQDLSCELALHWVENNKSNTYQRLGTTELVTNCIAHIFSSTFYKIIGVSITSLREKVEQRDRSNGYQEHLGF